METYHFHETFKKTVCKISDWIVILLLFGYVLILESKIVTPYKQFIPSNNNEPNINLNFPYKQSTVPTGLLFVYNGLPWIISGIISIVTLKCYNKLNVRIACIYFEKIFKVFVFNAIFCTTIVNTIKIVVGRPRPNYYALQSMNNNNDANESMMSFPSGHSSISFCFGTLLVLFNMKTILVIQQRFININANNNKSLTIDSYNVYSYFNILFWYKLRYNMVLSVIICFIPLYISIWVALTRIINYWHNYGDIICGSLFGIFTSFLSFNIFYYQLNLNYYNNTNNSLLSNPNDIIINDKKSDNDMQLNIKDNKRERKSF